MVILEGRRGTAKGMVSIFTTMLFSTKLKFFFSGDSQDCPFTHIFLVSSSLEGRGGGGEIVLNLIDILEELYQSKIFGHSIYNNCLMIKESV